MKLEIINKNTNEINEIEDINYIVYKLFECLDEKQFEGHWIKRFKRHYRYCEKMDIEVMTDNKVKLIFFDVPCKTYGLLDVYEILKLLKK